MNRYILFKIGNDQQAIDIHGGDPKSEELINAICQGVKIYRIIIT